MRVGMRRRRGGRRKKREIVGLGREKEREGVIHVEGYRLCVCVVI